MIRNKTSDPYYRFLRNGKAGYINGSGKVVIAPKLRYFGAHGAEFNSGLMKLGVSEDQYVDVNGQLVIDKNFASAWEFSDGLAAVLSEVGGKWGYIDRTGEFAIEPRFDGHPIGYPSSFSEGMAAIQVGKTYGYINKVGEFVIAPKFVYGTDFQDGMAIVVVEGPCAFYSLEGGCPDTRIFGETGSKPVTACKFTFVDKLGAVISGPQYDYARHFSEGLAPVLVGDKWGYIDKKGQMIIEPVFDDAQPFSDGMARVKQGEMWGYIDHAGKVVIGTQYEIADDFADGLAPVGKWREASDEGEFYYIDKRGVQAFSEKFSLASHFFKGLANVKLITGKQVCGDDEMSDEGAFAYIDVRGKKIFKYQNCNPEDD